MTLIVSSSCLTTLPLGSPLPIPPPSLLQNPLPSCPSRVLNSPISRPLLLLLTLTLKDFTSKCHSLNFYSSFKQQLKVTLSAMHSLASLFGTVGPSHPCSSYGNRAGPFFYGAVFSLLINYTMALYYFNL